jgi:glycosyltransferase involved in cell wall biosynthesis
MNSSKTILAFVIPCYNEEEVLYKMIAALHVQMSLLIEKNLIAGDSFIYLVDDGSKDSTWNIIESNHFKNKSIKGLKLANNVGHQKALLAGMLSANRLADCIISLDADLQDDISIVEEMLSQYNKGFDIVYGVRKERMNDSFLKKYTALAFYKLMKIMGVNIVYNHADFRLVSKRVVEGLRDFKEVNLFLRAIFPLIGFQSTNVYYNRYERQGGKSKYPLRKMISFAWDGITSFTVLPLRYITILGFITLTISVGLSIWAFIVTIQGKVVWGWASTVIPIYFLGSVQLLSLGIIGEYISKIYKEVKSRPRFIQEKELND